MPTRTHDIKQNTGVCRSPHCTSCSHHFPASKSKSRTTPAQAHFAGRTNPVNGLARCRTAPNPPPRAHSRIAKSFTQPAWARRKPEQRSRTLGSFRSLLSARLGACLQKTSLISSLIPFVLLSASFHPSTQPFRFMENPHELNRS